VLRKLRGAVTAADSVVLHIDELDSSDLTMTAQARWKREEGPRLLDAQIQRVRWSWLSRIFRNNSLNVPGEGAFWIEAREEGGWTGSGRTRGVWNSLPVEANASFAWRENRLTLDPLSGRSPAGNLSDGRLHWSKQGWDLTGTATAANPANWDVIGLRDWPAGNLRGRLRYAVSTRGAQEAVLDARLGPSEWSGWRADSALVRVDFPAVASDSFAVSALRRGGRMELHGRVERGGWNGRYGLTDFPLDEWPDGRATGLTGTIAEGQGTVEARAGGLWVTGALEGRSTRWFGMNASRWRLDDVNGRLLPKPEIEARARLRDAFYLGIRFDSASTAVRLGDQELDLAGLTAWAADTVITMSAAMEFSRTGWRMIAQPAAAKSRSFEWVAAEPVRLSGDSRGVTFERLVARDGEAQLEISGRWAVPGGSYDWQARARSLRLDRLGMPSSLRLSGIADADLTVSGPSGNPRWELVAGVHAPAAQGRGADSLRLVVAGSPSRLLVRELALQVDGGWLEGTGEVVGTARPWPERLTPEHVVRWLATGNRWKGQARARELALERVMPLLGRAASWSGTLEGTLELGGRPAQPEFTASVAVKPLAWRGLRLDEVHARAQYAKDRLRVEPLRATREGIVSEVTGEMEIRLALGEEVKLLDAPMRWQVNLPQGDLALLPLLVPQIGSASGRLVAQGEIRGTPRRPELSGKARIEDGRLRLAGREEVLEGVSAQMSFDASRIVLDAFTATQTTDERTPGTVRASGAMEFPAGRPPNYRFDVSMRDFTAVEPGVYGARFDGDFVITDGVRVGRQTLPHVASDNVEIGRAVILYDFAGQSEAEQVRASTQPLYWTYRLHLHATDNLRWQPPDGDIEFSADLNLEQTPEKLVIFGDMEALRGTYWFLDNRFTLRRATLTFDNVRGLDPLVDAEATTRLVPAFAPAGAEQKTHSITVTIQGRSSTPNVDFASDPDDLDEAQILRELTVGRFQTNEGAPLPVSTNPFDSYLTRVINRQLSQDLSRAFRGYLSDWEIARESGGVIGGQGGLIVGVGSQLNSRLALRYRQLVPGTGQPPPTPGTTLFERDLEAEYRLNRYFYVTSQLTQKRSAAGATTASGGTPDFNINLKARWEY
jgi:hypothetical protein